jgi:SAM-dependent methyltransferase
MQVLEHLRAPWEAAREISRVLRPGGCFVGSVAFLKPYHGSYFHMTHEGVRELLRPVGLELEVVDGAQSLSFATYGSLSGLPASSLLRLGMRALDRLIMRVRAMIWSATRRQSSHEPTDRFDPDLAMSFRVFDRVRFAPAIVFRARKTCDAADERQRAAMGSEMLSERIPEVEI